MAGWQDKVSMEIKPQSSCLLGRRPHFETRRLAIKSDPTVRANEFAKFAEMLSDDWWNAAEFPPKKGTREPPVSGAVSMSSFHLAVKGKQVARPKVQLGGC
mmetsp:Transcript_56279/g.163186  ORF Transcript_56279/g.163186 Transcript_56279/m.163186 type:complete len:101 (-) Transcript_56279:236-538(-)